MRSRMFPLLGPIALLTALALGGAHAGVPFPDAATPGAVERGGLTAMAGSTPISVTAILALRHSDEAEDLMSAVSTPGSPQYRQFLSADQFVARFAPTGAEVAKVIAGFAKYGLQAERTSATTLKVTGLPADIERAFAVSLRSYEVPAHGNREGYSFHAPLSRAAIPAEVSTSVSAVVGLDSRPAMHPMRKFAPEGLAKARRAAPRAGTGNPFGLLTVTDFANDYDVQPLYAKGVSGKGRTLGIMTFASFTPSDAFAYWSAVGLSIDPKRIKVIDVDGGPGAPSDASGSDETTLDVQQSGGVAPGAKIRVYQAPNTNQGFVDVFAAAIEENLADSLSISWGFWEWFDNLQNAPVTDPLTGKTASTTQAIHELLVRAAIQGQSVITSSGDSGAYEANGDLGCYGPYSSADPASCSLTLSVSGPGSDPAITAAGGTTLPGDQVYCLNAACTPPYLTISIAHEQVWGWDYLDSLCAALGAPDPISCGTFPGGTGGGVSVSFGVPAYQIGLPGVQRSQAGQVFQAGTDYAALGIGLYYKLPAHYAGRNVPDISANADPETGYVIYYTSDVSGFGFESAGGTSFVAPQLNGVSALLGEYLHGRIGLLNFPLYALAQAGRAYSGPNAPMHAIKHGDNWFYKGSNGYNPGAGLGTLDVANFANLLHNSR